jgi:hypothetical protein
MLINLMLHKAEVRMLWKRVRPHLVPVPDPIPLGKGEVEGRNLLDLNPSGGVQIGEK